MRILVVDDLPEVRELLRELLESEGHRCGEASNGREALEALRAAPADLVIADILMPVMDGYQLCREIRADERLRTTPFVFYTATYTDPKDEGFALALGADGFLRKPMAPGDFVAELHRITERIIRDPGSAPCGPSHDEPGILKLYNERLVQKLDEKLAELEREVSDRKRAEEALRESEERYRTLVEQAADAIFIVSRDARILDVNPAACSILGFSREELVGREFAALVPADDLERLPLRASDLAAGGAVVFERRLARKDGSVVPVEIGARALVDGRVLGIARDVTERKRAEEDRRRAEERMLHDAFHDRLTGLPNRALFVERLSRFGDGGAGGGPVAVLHVGLDRLTMVNESLGHGAGDSVLTKVAERIGECLSGEDTLARLTGDEFGVLLADLREPGAAPRVAERIGAALARPIAVADQEVFVSASIGIVTAVPGERRAEEILRDAHAAARRAKGRRRGGWEEFDAERHGSAADRLRLETALRRAIGREELVPYYEPVIDLETDSLVGFEALVRWNHPERGVLVPAAFLAVAEEADLVVAIDRLILHAACRQLRLWTDAAPSRTELGISVNFSSRQFSEPDVVEFVRQALEAHGLEPKRLAIEVTEGTLMENVRQTEAVLARLRALGVAVYIDDFGTGYSSLSYLHHFPFDTLKIDRSFIAEITSSEQPVPIVQTIISLADSMGRRVLAEGVETELQCARVRSLRCNLVQGYLFSRPVPAAVAENDLLLRTTWAAPS